MSYNHLTINERACIAIYLKEEKNITEIAKMMKRSKSTISRELKRNTNINNEYNPIGAQRKYVNRRAKCVQKPKLTTDSSLYTKVCEGLARYWSPEQIVNTLPKEMSLSHSTIYRAIDAKLIPKELCKKLRRYGKRLKHKGKKKGKAYDFSSVRPISKRPKYVEKRKSSGHWELDTVVLRPENGCHLASFVERKSRVLMIRKLKNKKAVTMGDVIIDAFSSLDPKLRKSLTVDRGLEFTDWRRVEKELNVKVYFCDAYSPQQRGTNENTNGLIRQFFPRRSVFSEITDEFIAKVESLINNRPRKCLHWLSPIQFLCCT